MNENGIVPVMVSDANAVTYITPQAGRTQLYYNSTTDKLMMLKSDGTYVVVVDFTP